MTEMTMVENESVEVKPIKEQAFNEMKRRRPGDNNVCRLCHSSLPNRTFAFNYCIGITPDFVNTECKLAKYLS